MVLKVVTGKILRTLGLSLGLTRLCSILGRRVELPSCLPAIQNLFRPAGACRYSAFTHGLRRGLHSCAASGLYKLSKIANYLPDNLHLFMLSEWRGRVKGKNWLASPGWDEPWKVPRLVLDPCEMVRARSFGPLEKARSFRNDVGLDVVFKTRGPIPESSLRWRPMSRLCS
jgi:hypothetical protein